MSPPGVTRVPVVASAVVISVLISPWVIARPTAQEDTGIRKVSASPQMLIPLHTRLRYTTMIVLPEDEEILDVVCGDKDFWVISATHNIAHVKPAKDGAATNLNLVTTSGAVYSFLLNEKGGNSTPDLKVYVNADESAPVAKPKYYTATQFDGVQAELLEARTAVEAEHRRATETIASYQQEYPSKLQFVYGTPKYEKPFLVRAIWHDGQFTYVKTEATELPALYEIKDGKPALVNFQVRNGIYVIPKVVERGYLALGKVQFSFAEQGR
jgi:type IV secretory pathway VirB9-like protein